MANITKTDKNWEKLFNKYEIINKIENDGFFKINSSQINEFRESRLMTKFDHKKNLPLLFQEHELSILPITRGNYIISNFDAYKNLEYANNIETVEVSFPSGIESIDIKNIYSEAAALNCAYSTGMINDFMEEESSFPTVSGRMSSSSFSFDIRNIATDEPFSVDVKNSQIEIDGGYESSKKLMLVEAKNSISSDLLIRQLYYPYRLWKNKVNKYILPVFMTYSNDVFSFFEFKFDNPTEYNSLRVVKQKNYIISPDKISMDDIMNIFKNVEIIDEPRESYPQADSFQRVINLLEMLMEEDRDADYLTHTLDVVHRQTNYYTSAGMYLGLVKKERLEDSSIYSLTEEGLRIMNLPYKQKYLEIARRILQNPSFYKAFKFYKQHRSLPSKDILVVFMKESNILNVTSDVTFLRRASTVRGWLQWIIDLQS